MASAYTLKTFKFSDLTMEKLNIIAEKMAAEMNAERRLFPGYEAERVPLVNIVRMLIDKEYERVTAAQEPLKIQAENGKPKRKSPRKGGAA